MRVPTPILAVAASALLLAPAGAQDGAGPSNKRETPRSAKVKELQRERIAALKAIVDMETSLYQHGKASPEAVLEARARVYEAELDAAENESARIAVLKSLVETLKQCEEGAKARKASAEGTEVAVFKVRARRLEAEIRLQQAQGETKNVEQEPKVVVAGVQAKDVVIAERFVCQIHSWRHIDIRSLQSGYLEEIQVKEGQAVKQGDVLFKIAPLLYRTKLDAELAEVEIATLNLKNTEKLFQNKVVSENEVAHLRARLASAQAKARLAQAELDLTVVRAPFDGLIDRIQAQQGSLATERESLTALSDNSVMWVYFLVPQTYYLKSMSNPVKGQEVELTLADGRKFPQSGKIAAIAAQFDNETGNIPLRADFPNPDGLLRHGMTGNLVINRTFNNAIVIPQRATFEILGKRYVYVVKEDVAHQREIVVQSEQGDDFVIKEGLEANDRIVIEGVRQIHDGDKLKYEFHQP